MIHTPKLVWLLIFFASTAQAGVNHKNGNFYIAYTDLIKGPLFEVTRTYNSKSTDIGLFGFGWGSDFESHLIVGPSGTPIIYHHGAGATGYFKPRVADQRYKALLTASIKKMVEVSNEEIARKSGIDDTERQRLKDEVHTKLQERGYRVAQWKRFLRDGKVTPPPVPGWYRIFLRLQLQL